MQRRRFLAATSAVLAGCLGGGESPEANGTGTAPATNGSASVPAGQDASASPALSEAYWRPCSSPEAVAADVDGTDLRLALTPPCGSGGTGRPDLYAHFAPGERGEPPRVRALLHNPGATAETVERYPLFGSHRAAPAGDGADGGGAWYFVPTAGHDLGEAPVDYERDRRGVWRLTARPSDPASWLPESITVDPRSGVEGEYAVVLGPDATPRGGAYRFDGEGPVDVAVYTWDETRPGPQRVSRFAGRSYPTITRRWLRAADGRPRDRTMAWYHEAGNDTELYLEPSAERVGLPARLDLTLVNHSDRKVRVSEDSWGLYKHNRGNWYRVAPSPIGAEAGASDPRLVNAGRSTSWTAYLFRDAPLAVGDDIAAGYLGGGTYAFDARTSTERGFPAAVFEVDAAGPEVAPDPSLPVRRNGTELVVGRGGDVAVLAERTAGSQFHVIPEQVMAEPVLRNTITHLQRRHELETVRFLTDRDAVDVATHTGDELVGSGRTVTCTFQGASYRLSVEAQ